MVAVTLAIIVVFALWRPFISDIIAPEGVIDEHSLLEASWLSPDNATYHRRLGFLSYAAGGNSLGFAEKRLKASLMCDPTNVEAWLTLASISLEMGNRDSAVFAVSRAHIFNSYDRNLIWKEGVLYLLLEQPQQAAESFRRDLKISLNDQQDVYGLFLSMGVNPAFVLEALVPPSYEAIAGYLSFVQGAGLVDATEAAWERLKAYGPKKNDYMQQIDFLLRQDMIADARAVWDEYTKSFNITAVRPTEQTLLWNGDFELPVQDGGFDWRWGKAAGVKVFWDRDIKLNGDGSLSAIFDGRENPDIRLVHQIVPVRENAEYLLTGFIKTNNITTKNGIFLEAFPYRCDAFYARSEVVIGTNLWEKVNTTFTTPAGCKTIVIAVRREASQKFDNKIGGDVWIDDLVLAERQK